MTSTKLASCIFLDGCVIERDYFFLSTRLDALPNSDFDHGRLSWCDSGKWNRQDRNWEVESVCVIQPSQNSGRAYAALESSTGIVGIYRPGQSALDDTLPGAEDGHGLPTMTQIRQIGQTVFAVGTLSYAFKRTEKGWQSCNDGLPFKSVEDFQKEGLKLVDAVMASSDSAALLTTIDGTSESNLFCAGANGAIYHNNGKVWSPLERVTNAYLTRIKTVDDKTTYIAGKNGILLVGNEKGFRPLATGSSDYFKSVEWFDGKLYVGGKKGLYVLVGDSLHRVDTKLPGEHSVVALNAYDGQLLAVCERWLLVFDGRNWARVDHPDNADVA